MRAQPTTSRPMATAPMANAPTATALMASAPTAIAPPAREPTARELSSGRLDLFVGNISDVNAPPPEKPASDYKAADPEANSNAKRIKRLPACAQRLRWWINAEQMQNETSDSGNDGAENEQSPPSRRQKAERIRLLWTYRRHETSKNKMFIPLVPKLHLGTSCPAKLHFALPAASTHPQATIVPLANCAQRGSRIWSRLRRASGPGPRSATSGKAAFPSATWEQGNFQPGGVHSAGRRFAV